MSEWIDILAGERPPPDYLTSPKTVICIVAVILSPVLIPLLLILPLYLIGVFI